MLDPVTELDEVHLEVQYLEQNLDRSLKISGFLIEKNKEFLAEN
jgi:hypothetical protein